MNSGTLAAIHQTNQPAKVVRRQQDAKLTALNNHLIDAPESVNT